MQHMPLMKLSYCCTGMQSFTVVTAPLWSRHLFCFFWKLHKCFKPPQIKSPSAATIDQEFSVQYIEWSSARLAQEGCKRKISRTQLRIKHRRSSSPIFFWALPPRTDLLAINPNFIWNMMPWFQQPCSLRRDCGHPLVKLKTLTQLGGHHNDSG